MKKAIIIGSGAAGMTAAFLLKDHLEITLVEKDSFLGGHVHTVCHEGVALDTGFMVLNDHTYPTLHKLFHALGGIELGDSDMSFGYYNELTNIQYAINFNPTSEFSKKINLSDTLPDSDKAVYRELLGQFLSFSRKAVLDLENGNLEGLSLGDYLQKSQVPEQLKNLYLMPMASAIWSTSVDDLLDFPAENLFVFFKNHGLMTVGHPIKWKYVKGGAKTYIQRIAETLKEPHVTKTHSAAKRVRRTQHGVEVELVSGKNLTADIAIFATHADEVLPLLIDKTTEEEGAFSTWHYQPNEAILHTDSSVMPPNKAAWASWNYHVEKQSKAALSVTYHLNRLQQHFTDTQYFLSLNRSSVIPEDKILKKINFTHPVFTQQSVESRKRIHALQGTRALYFCGSYMANGFHEDAVKSAYDMVEGLLKQLI